MFLQNHWEFSCLCVFLYVTRSCTSEPLYPPQLVLHSPGEPEYTDVLVRRVGDTLTLVCTLRGGDALSRYVWNYMPDNVTADRNFTIEPTEMEGPSQSSTLVKEDLQLSDSGRFMCSAPPFSLTKYILVQTRGPVQCARGAFWCGARCVLAAYVCDGFADCRHGEDEHPALCEPQVCARNDKLNCSSGRCISSAACCRRGATLCRQPACCDEYPPLLGALPLDDFPKQYEDRHAPDDYGFIQSTIYTVTACALIFMLAVVLLVSAVCKMHMKRAALRHYTQPDHYLPHLGHRFPPCYEASRLLEGAPPAPPSPPAPAPPPAPPRPLARLSSIFSTRYRQVPTRPMEVEMTSVVSRYRRVGADGNIPGGPDGADATTPDGRPDTPTVSGAELDFLDTYTLNGRTIRLLGAEFPPAPTTYRPPPYKMSVYGPPPHYLSRDTLQPADSPGTEDVELPPRYDELTDTSQGNVTPYNNGITHTSDNGFPNNSSNNEHFIVNGRNVTSDTNTSNGNGLNNDMTTIITGSNVIIPTSNGNNGTGLVTTVNDTIPAVRVVNTTNRDNDNNGNVTSSNNDIVESLSSIIDNLPAIDSDVNANENNDVTCDA